MKIKKIIKNFVALLFCYAAIKVNKKYGKSRFLESIMMSKKSRYN